MNALRSCSRASQFEATKIVLLNSAPSEKRSTLVPAITLREFQLPTKKRARCTSPRDGACSAIPSMRPTPFSCSVCAMTAISPMPLWRRWHTLQLSPYSKSSFRGYRFRKRRSRRSVGFPIHPKLLTAMATVPKKHSTCCSIASRSPRSSTLRRPKMTVACWDFASLAPSSSAPIA